MAHLLAPKPAEIQLPVFYNVDGVVGARPATNNREDVLLVQFAFYLVGQNPTTISRDVAEAARAVTVDGVVDPITINAITTLQRAAKRRAGFPSKVVDGRVSPARGGYRYGSDVWTIANLNNLMQNLYVNIWPRIDNIPGCPPELKAMVKRQVVGVGKITV